MLGLAQYLSRIGLLLDGNQGTSLVEGKARWLDDPMWQGLRRVVEDTMVVSGDLAVIARPGAVERQPETAGAALTVAALEIVVILGANGGGKTSLMRAISGLHPAGPGARLADAVEVAERIVHAPDPAPVLPRITQGLRDRFGPAFRSVRGDERAPQPHLGPDRELLERLVFQVRHQTPLDPP